MWTSGAIGGRRAAARGELGEVGRVDLGRVATTVFCVDGGVTATELAARSRPTGSRLLMGVERDVYFLSVSAVPASVPDPGDPSMGVRGRQPSHGQAGRAGRAAVVRHGGDGPTAYCESGHR